MMYQDSRRSSVLIALTVVGLAAAAGGVASADSLTGLPDMTAAGDEIISFTYGGTTYVPADGVLELGTTTRWFVDPASGQETWWEDFQQNPDGSWFIPPTTVPGTSNPKWQDVGALADNFLLRAGGRNDISSIDGIDFQETIFPFSTDTIFLFERGGNDTGTWQGINPDGSLRAPVPFVASAVYGNTGVNVGGQNAFGVVFTTDQPVIGARITAGGHDTFSISTPIVFNELTWDGLGTGQWGEDDGGDPALTRWMDAVGRVDYYPDASVYATINNYVVTVEADHAAASLTVNDLAGNPPGGIFIDGSADPALARSLTVGGPVDFAPGTSLVIGNHAALVAAGGTVDLLATEGNATIDTGAELTVAAFSDGGVAGTVTKMGAGDLVLTGAGSALSETTFEVQEGTLAGYHGSNPFGAAALNLDGGDLLLSANVGTASPVVYDNRVIVDQGGTLTAGAGSGGEVDLTVQLGSLPDNGLEVNGGTLNLRTTDDYSLHVAGLLSGSGRIGLAEGNVTLAAGGDLGSANVSGGILRLGAGLSVDSLNVSGGVVNTQAAEVLIRDTLRVGGTTMTISGAGSPSFNVSGPDLLAQPHLLTLGGGTLTVSGAGGPAEILYVVDNVPDGDEPGDVEVVNRLTGFGHTVTVVDDEAAVVADADGKDLVMIASTVLSGNVGTKFTDQDPTFAAWQIPTIQWESALNDEFMVSNGGGNLADQDTITITPEGVGHPLAAGLPQGDVLVRNSLTTFHTQGNNTAPDATVVARVSDGRPGILVVDADGLLTDGFTQASATRISLFLGDEAILDMTPQGLDLFDAALTYTLGEVVGPVSTENTNLSITASSTVHIDGQREATFGNLAIDGGVFFSITGSPGVGFRDVTAGDGATIAGNVTVSGTLAPGGSIGKLNVDGTLEFGDEATYACELGDASNDQVLAWGDVWLAGGLDLQAVDKLYGPSGNPPVQWYGEETRTVMSAQGENTLNFEFGQAPLPQPEVYDLPGTGNWGQGHLGHGVFLTRHSDDDPVVHPGLTYGNNATQVHLFQAADGDTNGNRLLGSLDIQAILSSNTFPDVQPADWPQGDFTGDGWCNGLDIQALLSTGLYPFLPGPYAAVDPGQPPDGIVNLVLNPATGSLAISTNDVTINGYVIRSAAGIFTGGPAENLGWFAEDTDFQISGNMGFTLDGEHLLGDVIGDDWPTVVPHGKGGPVNPFDGLTFTYTIQGTPGTFAGHLIVIPEPGTAVMVLGMGVLGLLLLAGRTGARVVDEERVSA